MQTTLAQFKETKSEEAFALQNSKLLKVRLSASGTIQAKAGSMVAYQGDVGFEHAGSGGLGRMLKKAVSGEGTTLMRLSGEGEVFLADQAQEIHLLYLEDDFITVNGRNLLAFDADIDWDIKRVSGGSSAMMAGGLFNTELRGTGWVAILSDGPPVLLNVAEARDVRRRAGRDHVVLRGDDGDQDRLQDEEPRRPQLGRDDPDGLQRAGLGARAAVGGTRHPHHRLSRASDVDELVVAGLVHRRLAARAPPARLERRAADGVAQRLGLPGRPGAPVGEQPQRAGQLAPARGELVDEARRALGVGPRDDQRLLARGTSAGR